MTIIIVIPDEYVFVNWRSFDMMIDDPIPGHLQECFNWNHWHAENGGNANDI